MRMEMRVVRTIDGKLVSAHALSDKSAVVSCNENTNGSVRECGANFCEPYFADAYKLHTRASVMRDARARRGRLRCLRAGPTRAT